MKKDQRATSTMSDKSEPQRPQPRVHPSSPPSAASLLVRECLTLFQTRQFKSCEFLTTFLVSSLESNLTSSDRGGLTSDRDEEARLLESQTHYATALELLGDCLSQMSPPQHRRAVSYYRRATTLHQHFYSSSNTRKATTLVMPHELLNDVKFVDTFKFRSPVQVKLQLKTFNCLIALQSYSEAYTLLNNLLVSPRTCIAQELRTFELSMEYANLCATVNREKEAQVWYLDALRANPYALDAIEMLATLGAEQEVVSQAVQEGLTKRLQQSSSVDIGERKHQDGDAMGNLQHPLVPIQDMIMAQFQVAGNQNTMALSKFRALAQRYPNNVRLLSKIALLEFHLGDNTKSEQTFSQIRQIDPNFMDHMDEYAELLRRKRAIGKLSQLSSDLLQINDQRPEAWVCLALYHQSKGNGNTDQSISFVERALRLNSRYAYAHYIRGMMFLLEQQPDEAVTSFNYANKIKKDVSHYEGLVEAYLMDEKYKEAVCMAKEAMTIAPKDPRTFTLIGLALSHSPATSRDGKEKAKRAFKKALLIDPNAIRPMFALSDIYTREEDFAACVELLSRAIEGHSRPEEQDMIHAKLADVCTVAENYADALSHYHVALSMNAGNMVARRGLDRLEKLMRGVDPDASGANDNSEEYDEEMDDSTNFEADAGEMGYL